ncbi:MAG: phosphatase PAP2 family protein [Thermoanaerobaculia bacterium]
MLFAGFVGLFLMLWGLLYATLPLMRRGGSMLVRTLTGWSARSSLIGRWAGYARVRATPFRMYLPVAMIVVAGLFLTAFAGDQFMDLAEMVHAKSPVLQNTDVRVHDWAVTRRTPGATRFFMLMTIAGGPVGLAAIVLVAAVALAVRGKYRWVAYLLATAGGGALLNMELKRYFARVRPDVAEMLRLASGYSFPSGHAMGSTVTLGALSYLAFRTWKTWRSRAAALALAITLIVAISLSRVYLGAHWISDVGAGVAAGTIWVATTTVAYETFRRIRMMRGMKAARG